MKFPEQFRWANAPHGYQSRSGDRCGIFRIPGRHANGRDLVAMAVDSTDTGWEHVSVSISGSTKTPGWDEMCAVKRLFWDDGECVIQFHPPASQYVNNHPGVLHLWKKDGSQFEMPPVECV